jgi:hypothetical protein
MLIKVNSDEIERLGITPNQYCLAYAFYTGDKKLFSKLKRLYSVESFFKEDIFRLVLKRYLDNGQKDPYNIRFDKCVIKGIDFDVEVVKEEEPDDSFLVIDDTGPIDLSDEWGQFVKSFKETFPAGVSPNGIYVRSSSRDCDKKLKKFVKEYPEFEREIILTAAEKYVKRYQMQGYKYMKTASYFIMKDGESTLAVECETIKDKGDNDKGNNGIFKSGI